jgi:hypothetical protein
MNLENLINEIIYNTKHIYKELGFDRNEIDVEIIADDDRDTLAFTTSILRCDGNYGGDELIELQRKGDSKVKFDIIYRKKIYINKANLLKAAYNRVDVLLDRDANEETFNIILTSLLEDAIIHELRHLYLFKTLQQISLQYVDIITYSDNWSPTFSYEFIELLERECINYTRYNSGITLIKDRKMKEYLSEINYMTDLLNSLSNDSDLFIDRNHTINKFKRYLVDVSEEQTSGNNTPEKEEIIKYVENNYNLNYNKIKEDDNTNPPPVNSIPVSLSSIIAALKSKFLSNLN